MFPDDVNGYLTHHTCCIFELLESNDCDYSGISEVGVTVWYQGMLAAADCNTDHLADALSSGPIALQVQRDCDLDPEANGKWVAPEWWEKVSQKLETSCKASLPDGISPSEYVL